MAPSGAVFYYAKGPLLAGNPPSHPSNKRG